MPNQRLPFLEPLRGFAILIVFLYHALGPAFNRHEPSWAGLLRTIDGPPGFSWVWPLSFGDAGVSIFFVISGFCIHSSHVSSREVGYHGFLIRRIWRILPPYLFWLGCFTLLTWNETPPHTHRGLLLVSHVTLLHTFLPGAAYFFGINPSFWSVATEAQLYVLYPLLLLLVRRWSWPKTLVTLAVVEFGLRGCFMIAGMALDDHRIFRLHLCLPLSFAFSWAIGAALADAHLRGQPLPFSRGPLWLWVTVACAVKWVMPVHLLYFPLIALATGRLIAGQLVQPSQIPSTGVGGWFWAALSRLGTVSYSLYLLHQPLQGWGQKQIFHLLPFPDTALLRLLICIALLLPLSVLAGWSYRFLEVPSIAWGKRMLQRRRASALPSSSHI